MPSTVKCTWFLFRNKMFGITPRQAYLIHRVSDTLSSFGFLLGDLHHRRKLIFQREYDEKRWIEVQVFKKSATFTYYVFDKESLENKVHRQDSFNLEELSYQRISDLVSYSLKIG